MRGRRSQCGPGSTRRDDTGESRPIGSTSPFHPSGTTSPRSPHHMVLSTTNPAITHVAVTVTDLAESEAWYSMVFGVEPILDEDTGPFHHVVFPLGATLLGLHGFPDLVSKDDFDERRPGLDHIAFGCADRDELAAWARRL